MRTRPETRLEKFSIAKSCRPLCTNLERDPQVIHHPALTVNLEKLPIRNPVNQNPETSKVSIPNRIAFGIMLLPIKLDRKLSLGAVEIQPIGPDRILTSELKSRLPIPKNLPSNLLRH